MKINFREKYAHLNLCTSWWSKHYRNMHSITFTKLYNLNKEMK